jgi:regulator of sigma E protease
VGETEYGLGWVPFGGYVKIAGMVDESMDKEQLKRPAEPYEFRSKPAWQRLIIMIGGVVVNVLLAIFLFIMIIYVWGEEYLPAKNLKYGIVADSLGRQVGLRDGDVILNIDGKEVKNFNSIGSEIILTEAKTVTVDRNGIPVQVKLPADFTKTLVKNKATGIASVRIPFIVDGFMDKSPAKEAGLRVGDQIVGIDSLKSQYFNDISKYIKKNPNKTVKLAVKRGESTINVSSKVNNEGFLGLKPLQDPDKLGLKILTKKYNFAEAIPAGFNVCFKTLTRYVTGLKQLFTGKVNASDSLGSVISIGNTFPSVWDWQIFWTLTAVFSIILAFMNILPIPALDGGHALFTIVEMVSGRKPSDKFMEYAQMGGMALLLGLMAYALGLDFWRLFK